MTWEMCVEVDCEWEERVTCLLDEAGSIGVSVEDAGSRPVFAAGASFERCRIRGYFEADIDRHAVEVRIQLLLAVAGEALLPVVVWKRIGDRDWQAAWRESLLPMPVGEGLLVLPTWLEEPKDNTRHIIRVDPEMAFGSGSHETTQGCLAALERCAGESPLGRVLDWGCGSGILSIAAALLGATSVLAVDNDAEAVLTCERNSMNNNVKDKVDTLLQDTVPSGPFSTIVANILAPVLLAHAPSVVRALADGGVLILSGILADEAERVSNVYWAQGVRFREAKLVGEWAVLTGVKGPVQLKSS